MGGTKLGGKRAAAANKAKYGEDYYRYIGSIGGRIGRTGGFYANRELASIAGALGGSRSTRKGVRNKKLSDKAKKKAQFERVYKHLINIGTKAQKRRKREQCDTN